LVWYGLVDAYQRVALISLLEDGSGDDYVLRELAKVDPRFWFVGSSMKGERLERCRVYCDIVALISGGLRCVGG